jgi:TMEM175 potassium channel family protein
MSRGRLEAFSDGVFAVAITLLALNLTVKPPGNGTLAYLLAQQWPGYLAYLISFFTIGIIWVNHHQLLSNIVAVTRVLLFLNLVLLMFVVLIPVVTGTVADYLSPGGFDAKLAVAVYGIVLTGMSASFGGIAEWSLGEGRSLVPVPPDRRWAARFRFMSGGLVYLAIVGIAFLSAPVALGLSGLVGVYYVFERTPALGTAAGPADDDAGEVDA